MRGGNTSSNSPASHSWSGVVRVPVAIHVYRLYGIIPVACFSVPKRSFQLIDPRTADISWANILALLDLLKPKMIALVLMPTHFLHWS